MSREEAAYGLTTFTFALAADAIRGFSMRPEVVYSQIRHLSGGTLFIGSINITGGTTLAAVGAVIPAGAVPMTKIYGPAAFAVAASGATTVATVIQGISQGYSGYASSNVY